MTKLENIGLTKDTIVVAYDDSRFAFAARLWWWLKYIGHEQVALLDGGWGAWKTAGYPITEKIPEKKWGNFPPNPNSEWLVDIDRVKNAQNLSSVVVIDSREEKRYRGEIEPIDPFAGHIEGAVNSPWQLVSDELGYILPLSHQQQLWQSYMQAEEIIVYCGSGVTACVNIFSLHQVGYSNAKLYPGGWSDWCSYLK